ncbi:MULTISPECIES: hypothetical protein [Commensalibacter]|uniref:hypothetical protein n=1 Tax=Commensalibacter TaxID=1079922 RepID=UPI0012D99726|nr:MULTISPECIES: hypothetical protein [Commensalibacter]MBI0180235.1 hypothetical protein [Commensalibacter sp. W8163]MUG09395.1 hypothetical protein [Commensalibacter melissae]MUH07171.1 hypothetical protein [Commensalibacter melissae]
MAFWITVPPAIGLKFRNPCPLVIPSIFPVMALERTLIPSLIAMMGRTPPISSAMPPVRKIGDFSKASPYIVPNIKYCMNLSGFLESRMPFSR